jgi:thioredoxin 1
MVQNNGKTNDKSEKKKNRVIFGIVLIIIGIGIILYLVFIGFGSDMRDDDVSLNQVKDRSKENTVVLFFWGAGCQPCKEQEPIIDDLEDDYEGANVTFYWLDAGKHDDLTKHYNVNGVPTTIILNQNGVHKKYIGLTDYDAIAKSIEGAISTYQ